MEVNGYLEYILKLFPSDTISLLDNVLTDDDLDPQYSAITVKNRLFSYLKVSSQNKTAITEETFREFLLNSGSNIMNNIGYVAQNVDIIIPFSWEATYTVYGKWKSS